MPSKVYEMELALRDRYNADHDKWACRNTVTNRIIAMGFFPQIEQLRNLLNDTESIQLVEG